MRHISAFVLFLTACASVSADTWNQFRGRAGGQVENVTHPLEWSGDKNVAWAAPMKGSGWSSPIVVGDRVIFTSAVSENAARPKGMMAGVGSMRTFRNQKPVNQKFVVSCLNLEDGTVMWSKTVGELVPAVIHPSNTYATESPTSDGKYVFTFFATSGTLTAWGLDGEEKWKKELGTYKSGNGFGSGSSLAISDGRVFVQFDNDESSFVAAFDTQTGEQVWRDDRPATVSYTHLTLPTICSV